MTKKPVISIVICTFNRLESLIRLIENCRSEATLVGLPLEIVVSDNSPTSYASEVVKNYARQLPSVRYVIAHPANISVARNQGIKAAQADHIAFIDDDATIEPGWVDKMYATLQKSGADCVLSAIIAKPEITPLAWDPDVRQFVRKWPMPDGKLISLTRSGRAPVVVSTNASLWLRQSCFKTEAPFDPDFGLSGGEDLDLFLKLMKRNIKIAWCGSAQCNEWVPASRMQFKYLFLRAFSGGQVFAASVVHNADHKLLMAVRLMGVGVLQSVVGSLIAIFLTMDYCLSGTKLTAVFASLLLKLAGALGKCLWFLKIPLYQIEARKQS